VWQEDAVQARVVEVEATAERVRELVVQTDG